MKTLNKIILTGLSVLSLNKLYSQDKDYEKFSENLVHGTSLKQLIFDSWYPEHSKALEKYTSITKQEIQSDSRFNILNLGLREYINKIYLIDQKDFFDSIISGHAHPYGGIICLSKDYNNQCLFHEAGHIRECYLDEINSDFSKKWKEIADFKYGDHNFYYSKDKLRAITGPQGILIWKDETIEPKKGCLKPLSAESINEDVAIFVECLGYEKTPESLKNFYDQFKVKEDEILKENDEELKLTLNLELYLGYFPLFFADTTDHRYQKKLDLLKEYEFLTKEEHEKLSENLGSLSYLLKK